MNLSEAFEFLKEWEKTPCFNVKIGCCSPQIENVILKDAMDEYDRCGRFRDRDLFEYAFIYCSNYVKEHVQIKLNEALEAFDIGQSFKEYDNRGKK
jgi:hypothetical protein